MDNTTMNDNDIDNNTMSDNDINNMITDDPHPHFPTNTSIIDIL